MRSFISVFFVALVVSTSVMSQTSGSTQPVGVMKISIPAHTDFAFGIPLRRASVYQGVIQSISGNSITLAGSPAWSTDQFAYASGTQPNTYYALIGSGAKEGLFAKITANDSGSITVSANSGDDLTSIYTNVVDGTGDVIDIIPYWTPSTLFPGMPAGTQLLIYSSTTVGINLAANAIYVFSGTTWFQGATVVDDVPFEPLRGVTIRANNGAVANYRFKGHVPMEKHRMVLQTLAASTKQDIRFYYNSPVAESIGTTSLGISPGDQLLVFDNAATGTNKAASQILVWSGSAWFQSAVDVTNTFSLQPGTSYILRKNQTSSPQSWVWSVLQRYLSP